MPTNADYTEKLHVGYRYYDYHNIQFTSGFPFGHGLSYTTFEYVGNPLATDNLLSRSLTGGRRNTLHQ